MAYQKKNFKKDRIPNVIMEFALCDEGTYDVIAIKEILDSVPWGSISIPVKAYKSVLYGDEKRGFAEVGFVKAYENGTFTVSISGRFSEAVSGMENPEIKLHVIEDKETGKLIIANINLIG